MPHALLFGRPCLRGTRIRVLKCPMLKSDASVVNTMKLFCAPGACSMASHIALIEVGANFEIESIDLFGDLTIADGRDFRDINPKGFVPVLELSSGYFLTENIAVLQFIADQNPLSKLAPLPDSMERYRLQEWLGFINSDLHRSFTPLFRTSTPEQTKAMHRRRIATWLDYIESELTKRCYLMGDYFTIADCYLFTVLNWSGSVRIDLLRWPAVTAYCNNIHRRESVRSAFESESHI